MGWRDNKPKQERVARTGASQSRLSIGAQLNAYFLRHIQTFFYALGQLTRKPFATLMTTAVIGIALAMPAGLHVLMKNVQQVLSGWDGATQVSLFLQKSVTEKEARKLADNLRKRADIASIELISRDHALEEFRRLSGFGEALNALEDNPLPTVLVVHPELGSSGPQEVARLVEDLRRHADVDLAQLDMQWVKRLFALMEIAKRGVMVLASLLALAVLLVVGNTIRLSIQNRRDEIVVIKLIGGTDAFIRRPFLYSGFWYGFLGAVIAFLMVQISLLLLREPVHNLSGLYNSQFSLQGLDFTTTLGLLGFGTLLGLFGSWLAVGRHLRDIEPT